MFRRLPQSLPPDPSAPSDLRQLGYFVNDKDQVRKIDNLELKYQYKIDRSERVNDVYKEAMNRCIRRIVHERLLGLGMEVVRLPIGARPDQQHVPILVSRDIKSKQRVIVVFGERSQDLGVFSYRVTGDEGIKVGSAIEMTEAMASNPSLSTTDAPGVILTNPGQLIWFRGEARAVSDREWSGLPRASAVHEPFRIDPVNNRAPGNGTYKDHVAYVFEHVLKEQCSPTATVDIIGLEYTGTAVVQYLAANWQEWKSRINGICLSNPQHTIGDIQNAGLVDFLGKRSRSYFVSDANLEAILPGRDKYGCNCYSSGEKFYEECILVRGWRSMLDWFNMIHSLPDYEEPVFTVVEGNETEDRPGANDQQANGW